MMQLAPVNILIVLLFMTSTGKCNVDLFDTATDHSHHEPYHHGHEHHEHHEHHGTEHNSVYHQPGLEPRGILFNLIPRRGDSAIIWPSNWRILKIAKDYLSHGSNHHISLMKPTSMEEMTKHPEKIPHYFHYHEHDELPHHHPKHHSVEHHHKTTEHHQEHGHHEEHHHDIHTYEDIGHHGPSHHDHGHHDHHHAGTELIQSPEEEKEEKTRTAKKSILIKYLPSQLVHHYKSRSKSTPIVTKKCNQIKTEQVETIIEEEITTEPPPTTTESPPAVVPMKLTPIKLPQMYKVSASEKREEDRPKVDVKFYNSDDEEIQGEVYHHDSDQGVVHEFPLNDEHEDPEHEDSNESNKSKQFQNFPVLSFNNFINSLSPGFRFIPESQPDEIVSVMHQKTPVGTSIQEETGPPPPETQSESYFDKSKETNLVHDNWSTKFDVEHAIVPVKKAPSKKHKQWHQNLEKTFDELKFKSEDKKFQLPKFPSSEQFHTEHVKQSPPTTFRWIQTQKEPSRILKQQWHNPVPSHTQGFKPHNVFNTSPNVNQKGNLHQVRHQVIHQPSKPKPPRTTVKPRHLSNLHHYNYQHNTKSNEHPVRQKVPVKQHQPPIVIPPKPNRAPVKQAQKSNFKVQHQQQSPPKKQYTTPYVPVRQKQVQKVHQTNQIHKENPIRFHTDVGDWSPEKGLNHQKQHKKSKQEKVHKVHKVHHVAPKEPPKKDKDVDVVEIKEVSNEHEKNNEHDYSSKGVSEEPLKPKKVDDDKNFVSKYEYQRSYKFQSDYEHKVDDDNFDAAAGTPTKGQNVKNKAASEPQRGKSGQEKVIYTVGPAIYLDENGKAVQGKVPYRGPMNMHIPHEAKHNVMEDELAGQGFFGKEAADSVDPVEEAIAQPEETGPDPENIQQVSDAEFGPALDSFLPPDVPFPKDHNLSPGESFEYNSQYEYNYGDPATSTEDYGENGNIKKEESTEEPYPRLKQVQSPFSNLMDSLTWQIDDEAMRKLEKPKKVTPKPTTKKPLKRPITPLAKYASISNYTGMKVKDHIFSSDLLTDKGPSVTLIDPKNTTKLVGPAGKMARLVKIVARPRSIHEQAESILRPVVLTFSASNPVAGMIKDEIEDKYIKVRTAKKPQGKQVTSHSFTARKTKVKAKKKEPKHIRRFDDEELEQMKQDDLDQFLDDSADEKDDKDFDGPQQVDDGDVNSNKRIKSSSHESSQRMQNPMPDEFDPTDEFSYSKFFSPIDEINGYVEEHRITHKPAKSKKRTKLIKKTSTISRLEDERPVDHETNDPNYHPYQGYHGRMPKQRTEVRSRTKYRKRKEPSHTEPSNNESGQEEPEAEGRERQDSDGENRQQPQHHPPSRQFDEYVPRRVRLDDVEKAYHENYDRYYERNPEDTDDRAPSFRNRAYPKKKQESHRNLDNIYHTFPDPIVIPHADNERMPPRPQPILIPTAKEPIDFRVYPYKSLMEDESKSAEHHGYGKSRRQRSSSEPKIKIVNSEVLETQTEVIPEEESIPAPLVQESRVEEMYSFVPLEEHCDTNQSTSASQEVARNVTMQPPNEVKVITTIRELPRMTPEEGAKIMTLGAPKKPAENKLQVQDHMASSSNEPAASKDEEKEEKDHYPFQYNIEIRKRFKGPKYYLQDKDRDKSHIHEGRHKHVDRDLDFAKYRKSEHKEEEHWHEKKWQKEDLKEEYMDGKPVKTSVKTSVLPAASNIIEWNKRQSEKSYIRPQEQSDMPSYAQLIADGASKEEIDAHFAVPSPGFRVDGKFATWVTKPVER